MSDSKQLGQNMDLPIEKLVPTNQRAVSQKHFRSLEASVQMLGLIGPLIVHPDGDHYAILDGCLRYRILRAMGVSRVPCRLWSEPADSDVQA